MTFPEVGKTLKLSVRRGRGKVPKAACGKPFYAAGFALLCRIAEAG
jgi:hypothetical protein